MSALSRLGFPLGCFGGRGEPRQLRLVPTARLLSLTPEEVRSWRERVGFTTERMNVPECVCDLLMLGIPPEADEVFGEPTEALCAA